MKNLIALCSQIFFDSLFLEKVLSFYLYPFIEKMIEKSSE